MTKKHEICTYQYGVDEQGNHTHIDCCAKPVQTGYTVYVREYENHDDEDWEEIFDKDCATDVERSNVIIELLLKYPTATEDWY